MIGLFVHLFLYFYRVKQQRAFITDYDYDADTSRKDPARCKTFSLISFLLILQVIGVGLKFSSVFKVDTVCDQDTITHYRSIKQYFLILSDGITCYLILCLFYYISQAAKDHHRQRKAKRTRRNTGGGENINGTMVESTLGEILTTSKKNKQFKQTVDTY
jgi:uncharacterized BrkB/YihY/UPF0761 family membrane protein